LVPFIKLTKQKTVQNALQNMFWIETLFSENYSWKQPIFRKHQKRFLETVLYFQFRKINTVGNILLSAFFCSLRTIPSKSKAFWRQISIHTHIYINIWLLIQACKQHTPICHMLYLQHLQILHCCRDVWRDLPKNLTVSQNPKIHNWIVSHKASSNRIYSWQCKH
jgi:hypothetical protein